MGGMHENLRPPSCQQHPVAATTPELVLSSSFLLSLSSLLSNIPLAMPQIPAVMTALIRGAGKLTFCRRKKECMLLRLIQGVQMLY
jgi:hypothetical protein